MRSILYYIISKIKKLQNKNSKIEEEYQELYDAMAKTGTGTDITLNNTAKGKMPIEVSGNTEQTTYTGKNLVEINYFDDTITIDGITLTNNHNGTVTLNGTCTSSGDIWINLEEKNLNIPSSIPIQNISNTLVSNTVDGYTLSARITNGTLKRVNYNAENYRLAILIEPNASFNNAILYTQIEQGSSATSFEPYVGGTASPNPDYPQDVRVVTGENNVKVANKNLFDDSNITFITGVLDDNGNNTGSTTSHYTENYYNVIPNTLYTISGTLTSGQGTFRLYYYDKNKNWISRTAIQGTSPFTFTTPINCYYIRIQVVNDVTLQTGDIQLEQSSTASTYEEHQEQTFPLNLGDIELCKIGDYQDYIYKNNDNWYIKKKISKVILNGTENWIMRTTKTLTQVFLYTSSLHTKGINEFYSNYFIYQEGDLPKIAFSNVDGEIFVAIYKTLANDVDTFKTWLSTHNTSLYYILKDEQDILITDSTLINQLNNLYNTAKSYKTQTHIYTVTEEGNVAPILEATALLDLNSIINS